MGETIALSAIYIPGVCQGPASSDFASLTFLALSVQFCLARTAQQKCEGVWVAQAYEIRRGGILTPSLPRIPKLDSCLGTETRLSVSGDLSPIKEGAD